MITGKIKLGFKWFVIEYEDSFGFAKKGLNSQEAIEKVIFRKGLKFPGGT